MNIDWVGFSLASTAVVLAPGPGSLFAAKTAATGRARAGLMAMLGIMVGDTCLITLALLGVSALFHAHPSLFHAVRFLGAGYLIFLGLRSIFTKQERKYEEGQDHGAPFRQAVAITLLNPKAVLFFMAFFPVFIRSAEGGLIASYAAMTVVFMAISAAYLSLLIRASSSLAAAFGQNRTLQAFARRLSGAVFIGFGLKAAATS